MKIALIGPSAPWRGGIAHYTARLFSALEAHGHRVHLIDFHRLYPELLFPGKKQVDESAAAFTVPSERILDPLAPWSWVRTIRRILDVGPDRLVLQWWHPYFAPCYRAVAEGASTAGVDVIFQCHNVEPHESTILDKWLLRLAYGGGDAFVVQSEPEHHRLRKYVTDEHRIRVAPHPPYDQFDAQGLDATGWRERLDVEQRQVLLFFGLVRPYKGLDILLEAMARLPRELDVALVAAGEHYGDVREYEEQIARLGLASRVRLYDQYVPNEDVAGLFELANACVLPYRRATGSGVANIALAEGVPLVMSALPDLRDAFERHAHWFEAGNSAALAEELRAVLSSDPPCPDSQPHGWDSVVEALTIPLNT